MSSNPEHAILFSCQKNLSLYAFIPLCVSQLNSFSCAWDSFFPYIHSLYTKFSCLFCFHRPERSENSSTWLIARSDFQSCNPFFSFKRKSVTDGFYWWKNSTFMLKTRFVPHEWVEKLFLTQMMWWWMWTT